MNREEFFKRRQVMAFEQANGVTKCEPGEAETESPTFGRSAWLRQRHRSHILSGAMRVTTHPRDKESDEPIPLRGRGWTENQKL